MTTATTRRPTARRDRTTTLWVVTRNRTRRPMLMHRVEDQWAAVSLCGSAWLADQTRFYSPKPIAAIACQRCTRLTEAGR